jgi:hypothetical protein
MLLYENGLLKRFEEYNSSKNEQKPFRILEYVYLDTAPMFYKTD